MEPKMVDICVQTGPSSARKNSSLRSQEKMILKSYFLMDAEDLLHVVAATRTTFMHHWVIPLKRIRYKLPFKDKRSVRILESWLPASIIWNSCSLPAWLV